jgi:hypothetical protein
MAMPKDNHPSSAPSTLSPGEVPALPEPTQEARSAGVSAGLSASRKPAIIAAVVALVILAALIAIGVLLFNNPPVAAVLRDIFIILLGIQSVIIGLLMIVAVVAIIYVALKVYDLIQFVENELRPMLERADDAVRTVQSRAVFMSDTVVKPVIEVMSYVSAVKSIIRTFIRPRN